MKRAGANWALGVPAMRRLSAPGMEKEIVNENDYGDHQAVQAR
jgi:hypothetical protein